MNQTIDYDDMGLYFNKSSRTLRRWEVEKPQKFAMLLEEYLEEKNLQQDIGNAEVIVTASQKGGVGKSTIADAFGFYLGDAVVLNVDIAQRSKDVNACKTIDYVNLMEKYSIEDIVKDLSKKYKYIIIDTPGEATHEVYEAMKFSKKIIIPMTIGKRTRETTMQTMEVFFGEGSELEGDYKIYFFFNAYTNKKKRLAATEKFTKAFEKFKKEKCSKNISIKAKLGALDYSDAISTAEEAGKSIFTLAEDNKLAYKSVLAKIHSLCINIEKFLEL